MTTSHDSRDLEARTEGQRRIYAHLLNLISPDMSQGGDDLPTGRQFTGTTMENTKPMRKGRAKVRLLA